MFAIHAVVKMTDGSGIDAGHAPAGLRDFGARRTEGSRAAGVVDRQECERYLKQSAKRGDVVIVAGARDESLSIWAKSLTKYA